MVLAYDKTQASIAFNYIKGYFESIPALKPFVRHIGNSSISLKNYVDIEIYANDFRSIRGRSILCAVLDECAFYYGETGASPDTEVYSA